MRRCAYVLVISLVLGQGCGGPPPQPRVDRLYSGLTQNLPRLDPSILSGRRIVIDPGHGGHFTGTLGQNGLQESNVNLGVSLYLWGLLHEAGADVVLTRSAERDFLTPADSMLATDLAARVQMVDSLKPDILVSIHHNAQNDRDATKNDIETYYRFGDPGSRDLAFAVHRHLMRNLGIEEGEVRPGNYYLLRNVHVTAILGEGSYLTNPRVEAKLRLSDKQRLEAEAYFLGILEYFSRGTPRLTRTQPQDSVLADLPLLEFKTADVGGLGIDPASVDLRVNGRSVEGYLDDRGTSVSYRLPWDTPNGAYVASLGVRNLLGNSSPIERFRFRLDMPPTAFAVETTPARLPRAGGTVRVRARLLDRRGLSVADSTPVRIDSHNGTAPPRGWVDGGFVEFPVTANAGAKAVNVTLVAGDKPFTFSIERGDDRMALRRIIVADSFSRQPIRDASFLAGDSLLATGSMSGDYFLAANDLSRPFWVRAPGHRPWAPRTADLPFVSDSLMLAPWYAGTLLSRRLVLDPEGGFGTERGLGQLGLSGPYVNLQVARYLAEYLRAAGALVELTRRTEETLSPRDVVAFTNRFKADRYIEIRHRSASADSGRVLQASFFPGSRAGRAMADAVGNRAARVLGLAAVVPRDQVTYPLQQTACPAIVVEFPSIASMDEELRLAEPWYQRLQAYALFLGTLDHFQDAPDSSMLTIRVVGSQHPENWLVSVDGTWNLLTSPTGEATFFELAHGDSLSIELRRGDSHLSRRIPPLSDGERRIVEVAP